MAAPLVKGRAQLRRKGAGIAVPRQLSTTLNALSGALRGRGDRLGNNFLLTDNYLRQLNPELPTIEQDFRGIADLGDNVDACLLTSLGKQEIAGEHTFGGDQPGLHIVIEVNKNQGPTCRATSPGSVRTVGRPASA